MSRGGTTLYVTGFSHGTRARDLAYEFERYVNLVHAHAHALALALVRPGPDASPSIVVLAPSSSRSVRAHVPSTLSFPVFPPTDDWFAAISPHPGLRLPGCNFAFVEYEDRRDADDAYHEMHNKRIGRDDILKIEWARTPPSASWRFESGRDRDRRGGARSPRRGRSPSPRRSTRDYSPRKDDRRDRDRDYDRESRRDRDRSRSPDHRDRERDSKDERDDRDRRENGTNGDERKALDSPPPAHDDLDVAE
ncbi:hypothetical protein FAGAP_8054 [Fusarium agapanthi]|uniref:RRM domain-containing protein n=1 Tax=Fusarium agapanthi TaxID=1803897 RepID=A0A9P5B7U3_9HYPO|nr:hypothetical protein FAGAP_8054 [Fusarium agapanthi]